MITAIQLAIGLLGIYILTGIHFYIHVFTYIQVLKTNLLINRPPDANAIATRISSTMKTKMATPIKVRGCIVTTCGVSPFAVGTRKYMNVWVKGKIYIKEIKSLP